MKKSLKWRLFLVCYVALLADTTLRCAMGISDVVHNAFNLVIMPILSLIIIDNLNGLTAKRALLVLSILIAGIGTRLISNDNTIMIACFFLCAFKGMDFDELLKKTIPIKVFLLVTILLLYYLGLTEVKEYVRSDEVLRYSYGFSNINGLSTYIFSLVTQIIYLHRKRIKFIDLLLVISGIAVILLVTASRTQSYSLILLLIYVIAKMTVRKNRIKRLVVENHLVIQLVINSFIIMALTSLAVYILYVNGNSSANAIDALTSGRISSVKKIVDVNGVATFGQELDRTTIDGTQRVLDNGYAFALLYFGPIVTAFLLYVSRKSMQLLWRSKKYTHAIIMAIYSVGGLMEKFPLEVAANPFLLSISGLIYKDKKEKQKC